MHQARFYENEREYLDGVMAFMAPGLAAGEPVAAAVPPERGQRLRRELNGHAGVVEILVRSTEEGTIVRVQGTGRTGFECWSCLLTGADPACPVCRGQMRFAGKCPVCRGTGEIDAKPRSGVSAFPRVEGLYHYLVATETDPLGRLVELEAELADDPDFDADQGAILVIPTAILSTRNIETDAISTIKAMSESPAQR